MLNICHFQQFSGDKRPSTAKHDVNVHYSENSNYKLDSFDRKQQQMLPSKSMCTICMLCIGQSHIQQHEIIAFILSILFIFCPCHILSFFHVQISTLVEYWFHRAIFPSYIIFPLLCRVHFGWISTHWPVESDLLWTVICTLCTLLNTVLFTWSSQLFWAGYNKAEIFGDRSDLTELLQEFMTPFYRATTRMTMCC